MVYPLLILCRFRNDRWFNMIEEVKSSYRDRFVFIYIFNFPRTKNFKTEKSRLDRRLFLRGTRNEREITLIPLLSRLKYKHATRILAWLITSDQGSEGIKYFSPSKGSRPAFFLSTSRFVTHQAFPPFSTSCLLFRPSRARTKRLRSLAFCAHLPTTLPSSFPPALLPPPCIIPLYRLTIFTSFQLLAPLFPFSTTGKIWEGEGEKGARKLTRGAVSLDAFSSGFHRRQTLVSASV